MFMFGDNRTEEERKRDIEHANKRQAEIKLSTLFLKNVRKILCENDVNVGLVSGGNVMNKPNLLLEVDGVTYKLEASVDHDD